MTFNEWLVERYSKTWHEIKNGMIDGEYSLEEIDEEKWSLYDEYKIDKEWGC
jgi:hypothetical protein